MKTDLVQVNSAGTSPTRVGSRRRIPLEPPVGVLWEFEDKIVDGKRYRVLSAPSNDTSTAVQYYWAKLETEAQQVIAIGQTRTISIPVIRRTFPIIDKIAVNEEIQSLLDACSEDEDAVIGDANPRQPFKVKDWVCNVLNARTGVKKQTLERMHLFHGTRQLKRSRTRSR